MITSRFHTEVDDDHVSIFYDGAEVLHWVNTEWREDPDVVIPITNAVRMAYAEPHNLIRILVDLGKLEISHEGK